LLLASRIWNCPARPLQGAPGGSGQFFFPACANALAAADFEAALVRPSRSTEDAAVAAFEDVVFAGAPVWERALAAAVLEREPVDALLRVCEALVAAFVPVVFPLAIRYLSADGGE
jgi:hypothetical protein